MAIDRGDREVMHPLIMRAKQIVYCGNSNGDTTAKRVDQRMKDADLINSRGFIKEGFTLLKRLLSALPKRRSTPRTRRRGTALV